jgi:hypothetical protein
VKRELALNAIKDAAEDFTINDLESIDRSSVRVILYPFLEKILSNEKEIQKIMLPHE